MIGRLADADDRACRNLAGRIEAGIVEAGNDVRVGARFPLADAGAAQSALASRGTTGKLLLTP